MRQHKPGKGSRLQLELDREFSKLIRDKGKCERCGSIDSLDTAHIIGRANKTLRWDILNVLCLCRKCHQEAHANPKAFDKWLRGVYSERMDYLDEFKNILLRRTIVDYEELLQNIKDR